MQATVLPPLVNRSRSWWFLPALIMTIGLGVFLSGFPGVFLFDDKQAITDNWRIRHLWPLWPVLAGTSRPLVNLSFAINYALSELRVWGYHAVNVAIHLLAALTLFEVVRRTLVTTPLRDRHGLAAPWLAFSVAALWVVHPLHTESVTYIVQRAEALMGLCYLLTLYCVIRTAQTAQSRWQWFAVVWCALGMASKPVMVSAPLVAVLYDRVFFSGTFRETFRKRGRLYLGLMATWLLLAWILSQPHESRVSAGFSLERATSPQYALTQVGVITHYLKLIFWPLNLCLDYGWPLATTVNAVLFPGLLVSGLLVITLWAFSWWQPAGFLGASFFLLLAPTSSFIPLADPAAEHRLYLPLIMPIALVVVAGWSGLQRVIRASQARRVVAMGLMSVGVAVLGALTILRNRDYHDAVRMWRDVVAKRPANVRAHTILAGSLAQQGYREEAEAHFAEALRLDPKSASVHINWGVVLVQQGRVDEAVQHFQEATRLDPRSDESLVNLGNALLQQRRADEAVESFTQALQINPNSYQAHVNLGNALIRQNRLEEAMTHLAAAHRLNPHSAAVHNSWGAALVQKGRFDEAIQHFRKALHLNPNHLSAQQNLERIQTLRRGR